MLFNRSYAGEERAGMLMPYRVHSGLVVGRSHLVEQRNCQDALYTTSCVHDGRLYCIGMLADGCSEGKHSEVGAQLAVRFVVQHIKKQIEAGQELATIPATALTHLLHFLTGMVGNHHFSPSETVHYIEDYLLFTLIGYIIDEGTVHVFAMGDGVVILNERLYVIDQQNRPRYIGYHVLEGMRSAWNKPVLPEETIAFYTLPSDQMLQRLAIGSDAWGDEQPLLADVWNNRGNASLQLRMNRWSSARHFKDDASLIVVERMVEQPTMGMEALS